MATETEEWEKNIILHARHIHSHTDHLKVALGPEMVDVDVLFFCTRSVILLMIAERDRTDRPTALLKVQS